jgi:hypothetical protein
LDVSSDPAEEWIAATTIVHRAPLVTRDKKIKKLFAFFRPPFSLAPSEAPAADAPQSILAATPRTRPTTPANQTSPGPPASSGSTTTPSTSIRAGEKTGCTGACGKPQRRMIVHSGPRTTS